MPDFDHWLEKVYEAGGDRETLDRLYDDWAQEYDGHLWASGNPYLAITAGMTARHLRSFDATILDAGCGYRQHGTATTPNGLLAPRRTGPL